MYHCLDLCRKRKPRKNTLKNWIPKELRTATSQPRVPDIAAANEEPIGDLVTGTPDIAVANEDEEPIGELVTRAPHLAAANEAQHTTATSPPRSVNWLVKKITPRKKLKNRGHGQYN